jgi:hypothetical protein
MARNVFGLVAVYFTFSFLLILSPEYARKEAELSCINGSEFKTAAVFPNIVACGEAARPRESECFCFRPRNEWYLWYVLSVVPVLATIVGYAVLHGPLSIRLLLLNVAIAAAIITETVRRVLSDPAAGMGLPFVPFVITGFCVGASLLYVLIHYGDLVRKHKRGIAT